MVIIYTQEEYRIAITELLLCYREQGLGDHFLSLYEVLELSSIWVLHHK